MKKDIDLTLVIPAYNESQSLPTLIHQISDVVGELELVYEILVINDGSTDNTNIVCAELIQQHPQMQMIEMLGNTGKAHALQVGFQQARGDIVIMMDADLQDDPNEIPRFLAEIEKGYDVVVGWKKRRQDPLEKTLPSRLFNKVTSIMVGLNLHDYNCGFKAFRRYALANLSIYGDLHRFIPALLFKQGFKVTEIPVEHHPRTTGKSKYGFERYFRGFFDLITVLFLTNFLNRPLHLIGGIGLISFIAGLGIDVYLAILWLLGDRPIGNRPLLTFGTLLIIVGVQTFLNGLLAELFISLFSNRNNNSSRVRRIVSHDNLGEE